MSPASYLTAPPRVAAPSIAPARPVSSIRHVTTGIWIGLGIFLLALLLGTVWVGYQVVKSWKYMRDLSGMLEEVGKLARSAEDIQIRLTNVERQVSDLQRQVDSLGVSVARAKALAGAASEVRSLVDNVRGFVPTK